MADKRFIEKNTFAENELSCSSAYVPGTTTEKDGKIPLSMLKMQAVASCSSAASEANKTATVNNMPDFELRNGILISVYFANGNTAESPSLNINSKGSWPLRLEGQASGVTIGENAIVAGGIYTVQYVEVDSSNKFFVLIGHSVAQYKDGIITKADGATVYNKQTVDSVLNSALANYLNYRITTFNGGLTFAMKNSRRFCFDIIGTGINGTSYGSARVWGYGSGGTARYHAVAQGSFSVSIGAEGTQSFTVTCPGANNISVAIFQYVRDDVSYELSVS